MIRVALTLRRRSRAKPDAHVPYVEALSRAGAEVVPVWPDDEPPRHFDALCLSGGGDVHPSRYGQDVAGSTEIDEERDALEFDLFERAARQHLPVLGICRGMQLMNVALGGSLGQHVTGHDERYGPLVPHEVTIAPRSLLEAACGRGPMIVNSRHHQAVRPRDLGRGLRATAVVGDVIEALEAPHLGWAIGVQWHPERTAEVHVAATRIFDAFVRAAANAALPTR
jgi:putative glutamine amidotransferase